MLQEIERKFLVKGNYKKEVQNSTGIIQGYLVNLPERSVRIRINGEKGLITIKGKRKDDGISRFEWEKEIPYQEAKQLLGLCEPGIIEKTRHEVFFGKHIIEIDEFHGDNQGLVMAEIELASEEEAFEKPDWLGEEVSFDQRYYNVNLVKFPFKFWDKED
jgi:adenylate cyclase